MPDDSGAGDAERLEQLPRIPGHVVEVVRNDWLGRTAEADLIGDDNAETRIAQQVDWTAKVEATKVHAMQQDYCAAVRRAGGRHIHVRQTHILAVNRQRQV